MNILKKIIKNNIIMKFEFAKYTEITSYYKKHSETLNENDPYIRFFLCSDVNDFWLLRILENRNEEYEFEEGVFLCERDKIQNKRKGELPSLSTLKTIVKNDEFSNWDMKQYDDITELINDLDAGFGINNLNEE